MMVVRILFGFALALAPIAAAAQSPSAGSPSLGAPEDGSSGADNQIRLDRPVGGGSGSQPDPGVTPRGQGVSGGGGGGARAITDISPEETLRIFQSAGFDSVRLVEDKTTDFLRVQAENAVSFILHANCTDGRCRALQFTAFVDAKRGSSLNFVNSYNLKTLHTKMSRNDAGEIVLTMTTNLNGGVTAEHLRALAPFWISVYRDARNWR